MSKIHTPRYNKYYDLRNVVYKAWGDLMAIDTTGAAPGTSHADGQKVTGEKIFEVETYSLYDITQKIISLSTSA